MIRQLFFFFSTVAIIIASGRNLELSLILASLFCVWYFIIKFQIKWNNLLFLIFGFCFFLKFVFIPFIINIKYIDTNSLFTYSIDNLIFSVCITLFFLIAFFLGQVTTGEVTTKKIVVSDYQNKKYIKLTLSVFVLIGIFISFNITSILQSSDNRVSAAEGTGYLFFLGYSGYLLTGYFINEYIHYKKSITSLCVIALVCGLFFLFRFHRGGFLYPLSFVIITFSGLKFGFKKVFWISIFLIPLLFEINIVSSALRTEFLGTEFNFDRVLSRVESLNKEVTIPLAFGHIELLSALLYNDIPRIYPTTFFSSFLNWVPRFIFADKALTTGPVLALTMFPDTRTYNGGYDSSLTTGILVELYYNFKLMFFIPAFLLGFIYQKVYNYILKLEDISILIIFLWLFGFVIFFDDLGGWINKVFICFILAMMIQIIKKIRI
ncbi:O-antigen polymerase [Pontibacter mangrovi]|uniref:Oligosaccharide repeat unit polymerase n=1 Tax=Pontibacter mangrovi TaxID=2589816 RepID=A0A501VVZ2_9BACT|nr:O-antigen polymerase [Pontibacter mangrovi]TPE39984.1 oligosaccharide repeat unit polymerase [Pontibacter mangrovi]